MLIVEFADLEIGSGLNTTFQALPQLRDKKNPRA
jgi:hypothetical protein